MGVHGLDVLDRQRLNAWSRPASGRHGRDGKRPVIGRRADWSARVGGLGLTVDYFSGALYEFPAHVILNLGQAAPAPSQAEVEYPPPDPNPVIDFVAKLPRRLGYNLGP